jgi:hypothetical protein
MDLTLARQVLYYLSHSTSPFFSVLNIFEIGSHELFAWAAFKLILLICASYVTRIIDVGHWCQVPYFLFIFFIF